MNKKVFCGLIVIVLLIVGGLIYSRQSAPTVSNSSKKENFKLSLAAWVGYGPFYLAKEKGFFDEQGVNVEIIPMEDVAAKRAAMIKGDIDGLGDTLDSVVLSRANNIPLVGVSELDISNGADGIVTTQDVKTVQDLKGKTIALQKNFVSESFLNYLLKQNGLSPNDVKTIDTEAGAAGAAFVSGKVDAAVTWEPWLSKAKERQGGKVLVSSADTPGVIVDIFAINEAYLKNHPKTVKKVMAAWYKAVEYWKSHPEESNEIMAKYYNIKTSEFADNISGLKWPSVIESQGFFGKDQSSQLNQIANTFADLFLENKQTTNKPDLTKAFNSSLLWSL